jgi:hypothetical protein
MPCFAVQCVFFGAVASIKRAPANLWGADMKTTYMKSQWGMDAVPDLRERMRMIAEAGYDGIEGGIPSCDPSEWQDLLAEFSLESTILIGGATSSEFAAQVEAAAAYKPLLIIAHGGLDRMDFKQGCEFFLHAIDAEQKAGIPVAHETHRARLFYTPWVTRAYLEEFPDLKICADFSHWCVVTESMLDAVEEAVQVACERTIHIHARVGYEEGPQVPDPSAPEFQSHVERHEAWWDAVRSNLEHRKAPRMTVTPEFGPPGYMHTLPHTRQPVADLWEVCLYMKNRLQKRWAK